MYSNWLTREEEAPDFTEEAEEPVRLVPRDAPLLGFSEAIYWH